MTCYRPADLALKWHCSERYIKRMLADGRLTGFRIGKLWRIRQVEVERWESSQGSSSTEENGPSKKATVLTGDDVRLARMTVNEQTASLQRSSVTHLSETSKDRRR